MIKQSIITIATLGLLSVTASAEFSEAGCIGCHGANFEKAAMGKSKIVKDMTAEEIITSLNGYKDGTYGGPMKAIMKGQANSMSEDDIKAFAEKHGKK
ncbi:MAG: Cytochrome C553 (soluble cytochrome f) [uncultured Sulfurovum sp.]|uniref:Cytochrome C553 (Soluble cytochrome f) n=1 Tax=uncultured Sulfurovum sp. TaxID=269237 RepID=A0A6S6SC85_9BACT|nr:MAG: Cytochrome C553 (soluble cytochrome f) [uncultured Sulfurovum sp.]